MTEQLSLTVFSAARYVEQFMTEPLRAAFSDIKFIEAKLDKMTAPLAAGSTAVCLFVNDDASAPVLEVLAGVGVKMIALRCAGFDRVDLDAAAKLGIQVARVPVYSPNSVAEMAVALMLCINRNLQHAYVRVREGDYSLSGLVGFEVASKTIGIIGTGAIGFLAARAFAGFGAKIIAYDVFKNQKLIDMGIPYLELNDLLAQADIISLHCPLLPSTYHLINDDTVKLLKPGCIIINTSRGALINTDSAIKGLMDGQIGGLGLDVYEEEDALFFNDWSRLPFKERRHHWDNKFQMLKSFPTVLITPHSAFLTEQALANIAATTVANLREFADGKELTNKCIPLPPMGKK